MLPLNSLMKCELDGNDRFRVWRHSVGYILCNKLSWFVSELSEKDIPTFREEAINNGYIAVFLIFQVVKSQTTIVYCTYIAL